MKFDETERALIFIKERETKNTVRFKEETVGPPIIGTLYLQKWWVKDTEVITVKLEKGTEASQ
jgi:hypothetical protein